MQRLHGKEVYLLTRGCLTRQVHLATYLEINS
jgi:hypothetical protein